MSSASSHKCKDRFVNDLATSFGACTFIFLSAQPTIEKNKMAKKTRETEWRFITPPVVNLVFF